MISLHEYYPLKDSPTEQRRKELPHGDGDWPGFDVVYKRLYDAAMLMAKKQYVFLSEEHINTMAILGCGHEETMKAEVMRLRGRGFIQ